MGVITEIQEQRRRRERVSIFVDGRFALGLSAEAAIKGGLRVGQEISDDQLRKLEAEAILDEGLSAALKYLAARPRSERELRTRLRRRGVDEDSISRIMDRLRSQGLLDDQTFAQFWVDQRVTFKPRSRRLLERELRVKGVDKEVIQEVVADLDDEAEAYRAGVKKARAMPLDDYGSFYKKLVAYLQGRGFGYSTASKTAKGLWSEIRTEEAD